MQGIIDGFLQWITNSSGHLLMPAMVGTFFVAVALRFLVTFTVSRELWFAKEFEKRAMKFLGEAHTHKNVSFHVLAKHLLEKTYYELFEVRAIMKRRKPDSVRGLTDRLFLIQHGIARLVDDTLKRTRHLKRQSDPKMVDIGKSVFEFNPCFRKVFGIIPVGGANDFLSILPGILIVSGILGTFLGIMRALPELGGMNLNDMEGTKAVMDDFLVKVSYSMATSAIGIMLSLAVHLLNTFFSAERSFLNAVDKYTASLDGLWSCSDNNDVDANIPAFDEHKDPIDALARDALSKELERKVPFIQKAG